MLKRAVFLRYSLPDGSWSLHMALRLCWFAATLSAPLFSTILTDCCLYRLYKVFPFLPLQMIIWIYSHQHRYLPLLLCPLSHFQSHFGASRIRALSVTNLQVTGDQRLTNTVKKKPGKSKGRWLMGWPQMCNVLC